MTTMEDIEKATKEFADARQKLVDEVNEMNKELEARRRERLAVIRKLADRTKEKREVLNGLIYSGAALFKKPRTRELYATTVGLRKGTGSVEFAGSEATVIALIKKKLKALKDTLIKTTEKVVKSEVKKLTGEQLAMIGCTVESTGDVALVKPADSKLDEHVAALLAEEDTESAEAA